MNFKSIWTIAKTEAKIFARSWIFRILSLIMFIILGYMNFILYIPKGGQLGSWIMRNLSSFLPYFNFLILTVFESLIVIFGALDSNQRDFKLDISESLHARSFTNLSYMIGKVLGIMLPFLIMNLAVFILALVINGVFVDDVPVLWKTYAIYPLLLSFPALFFMTSLSFAVMNFIRNKPLSMLILVGYFILTFFFKFGIIARLIDFNGLHLPMVASSFVGLENMGSVLAQRGFFVFFALGCIMLSAIFFKRLPQSVKVRKLSAMFIAVFMVVAVISGALFSGDIYSGMKLRERVREMNEKYIGKARAKVTACDLDIVHKGSKIETEAALTVLNPNNEQMKSVFFSLNPGFTVRSVTAGGIELEFKRETQILDVTLGSPLMPDTETMITVVYEGTVNDKACYPDIDEKERIKPTRYFTYVINKRYGFISKDYVLLTPECQWYPVSGIPFGMVFPDAYQKDFTDYKLDISTSKGLTAVSQGAMEKTGDRQFSFRPETKLHGLTLAVGNFEKKAIEVDGVEIALYIKPGHDYFSEAFKNSTEAIISYLEKKKRSYENYRGMKYPFPRYLIVESPVQFHSYERPWSTYMETGQPQISIVPERGSFQFFFDVVGLRNSLARSYQQNNLPEEEIIRTLFDLSLSNVFFSDDRQREDTREMRAIQSAGFSLMKLFGNIARPSYVPSYTLSAQLCPFMISFESEKYPIFNTIMEFYRKHGLNINTQTNRGRTYNPLLDEEIACIALERDTFANILKKGTDFDTMNLLLMLKSNQLLAEIQTASGDPDFGIFLDKFIKEHAFSSVNYEDFAETFEEKYGMDLDATFETWYNESRMPMFTISDVTVTEIIDGDYTSYQTNLTITNTEPVRGLVWIQLRLGGIGNSIEPETRFIAFDGNQTKEIGIVTATAPPDISVNTMISQNLPLIFNQSFGEPKVDHAMKPFDGERVIAYSPPGDDPGTIIVDNLDEGFEIISEPKETGEGSKIDSRYNTFQNKEGFIAPIAGTPPWWWGKSVFNKSYGGKSTAFYTRPGDGEGRVAWNADISEQGSYDLEFFLADFTNIRLQRYTDDPNKNKPLFGEYNLLIKRADNNDSITFVPDMNQPGWQYVSSFDLKPGEVCVELSNESTGRIVYADAIRWVKRK